MDRFKKMNTCTLIAMLLLLGLPFWAICQASEPELPVIRIGWQIPWATQGQLIQVLKRTNILEKNGIRAIFVGRTYGPLLNEAALAGGLDMVLTADQPAAALFAKDKGWIGIGRLMYNRTLTYVPPNSSITTIKDLKGKTIGVPIGAAAERVLNEALARNGINPATDAKIINVDIREQIPLVLKGKSSPKWDNIDALSGFDPTPAIFESQKLVRVLDVGKVVSLVLMNESFIKQNPDIARNFMRALVDAYEYYSANVVQANEWFLQEAGLQDGSSEACNLAAAIEPNLRAKNRQEIRVWFSDEDYSLMQIAADFIAPKINKKIDMRKYVSNQFATESE